MKSSRTIKSECKVWFCDLYKSGLTDLAQYLDTKTVVISLFGMSSYQRRSCKAGLVDEILEYQIFKTSVVDDPDVDPETMSCIEGCYSSSQKVLFLHLRGMFDTHSLVKQYQHLKEEMNEKGYLSVWAELKHSYARALLFLFSISHVLIVNHPSPCLDISYIHLFRALDTVRLKLQPSVSEALSKITGVSSDWATNGRFCSPRVLWFFENCPPAFRRQIASKLGVDWKKEDLKKVGHDLEDQIYSILRKSRVITNVSTNSLFAIPPNKEYVFMLTEPDPTQDWIPYLVNSMVDLCRNPNLSMEQNHCSYGYESLSDPHRQTVEQRFQAFLQQHIDQAFSPNGFEDNTGRHAHLINPFETPPLGVLLEAANVLHRLMVSGTPPASLHSLLDTDVRFSEARCSKVLPLATATYQENLPANYTREYHLKKVSHALGVFGEYARGPLVESYIEQLQKECERHWKSGRQMCEVLSMTGNPCTKPLHKGDGGELPTHQLEARYLTPNPILL
ncbi:Protein smg8 [Homalodisca vitripennis]|nr:Protein smg8 [Homalodisca vitripennis]